jgi:Domain of unknown function (DUF1929)/Glyoxal oxidase N-terminus/Kelch motif
MRRVLVRLGAGLLLVGGVGCGDGPVTPETASQLTLTVQPSSSALSGDPLLVQPQVQLTDNSGNPVSQSGLPITAELAAGSGGLSGTLTYSTDANGTARFTDLSITGPLGSYTLQFSATGLAAVLSDPVTIVKPPATLEIMTQPPSTALNGEVFDPSAQPVVEARDENGTPAAGVTVTAAIESGGGALEGATAVGTDANGLGVFTDLGIRGAAGPRTLRFTAAAVSAVSNSIDVLALSPEASLGLWSPPVDWPIVPVHMHLLPTGKVLAWGKFGQPQLWDPGSGTFREVAVDTLLFCAGHAFLADGQLLVSGGHLADDRGIATTYLFNPATESWEKQDTMVQGRWYPTVTVLGDGKAVTVAGRDQFSSIVTVPELWNPATRTWTLLTGAPLSLPYYPRDFLAPDGRIFYAGERIRSHWLDVNATGSGGPGKWRDGPDHQWRYERDYGSAVMYEPGKILFVGGGGNPLEANPHDSTSSVPTSTAEIIDLTQPAPQWRFTGSMQFPRRHLNATVLPDGQVLVAGGTQGGGFDDVSDVNAVHAAEVWDPGTGQWTTLASNTVTRVYHSVSVLLPDGRIVHAASGDADVGGSPAPSQRNSELFSPPYLFKGARPIISSVPSGVAYGERFMVETPNSAQITKVTWVRLSSVTHSFDQNQRFNALAFEPTSGGVIVTAPTNPNLVPPGHYTLFVLNRNGVPSVGRIIRIQ